MAVMAVARDRAAWLSRNKNDTFVDAVAENLLDRLEDCKKSFPSALCLRGSLGAVQRLLRMWSRFVAQKSFPLIKESSVDLIISSLAFHWTNDLPGSMIQVFPFRCFFPVYVVIYKLRIACTLAHMKREGGISPRLSPLAQVCV
ncbi:unnamed protein product [Eruca vesicaria subsp. sativa]|uniref:Uncharacterized protein n=1 Tax=Eruca vesicaria subsp. sativa TaxID=29727 RepID=A0ABC8JGY0_ERUVS|nr:unnamed protein product [Eruca vesicaria subsp. sativa]